jgi:hypothetical protein
MNYDSLQIFFHNFFFLNIKILLIFFQPLKYSTYLIFFPNQFYLIPLPLVLAISKIEIIYLVVILLNLFLQDF